MTHLTARLAPPNSLLLALDPRTGELPPSLAGQSIAATSSGLAIGTLAEVDGETEVHLADATEIPERPNLDLRWDGTLTTRGRLGVLTIYNQVLMEMDVGEIVRVQIWTNDPVEPDVIWVATTS
jgi:hypothetical protein